MRLVCLVFLSGSILVGCSTNPPSTGSDSGNYPGQSAPAIGAESGGLEVIVTPGGFRPGKVAFVNPRARYVVATFPIGALPGVDQQLYLYRGGLKVGEIKITGPEMENNTTGDLTAGEARVGDEVRLE